MRRLAPILLASATGCGTYAINRAAFVPHATPVGTDGQSLVAPAELLAGASNATDLAPPRVGDPAAGVAIPNTQLHGAIAARLNDTASLSFGCDSGLVQSARPVKPTEPPVNGGNVTGCGPGLHLSIATSDPHWRIGLSTELTFWSIPWIAYSTCIDGTSGCSEGYTTSDSGSEIVPTMAVGLVPSYRSGQWTLYGGLTVRNHPTVIEKSVQQGPETDGDVQAGPANVVANAGAELDLDRVLVSVELHQELTRNVVAYGPSLGVMLTVPLGERVARVSP